MSGGTPDGTKRSHDRLVGVHVCIVKYDTQTLC